MSISNNIFNQYYFAFLKKVKDIARDLKHQQLTKDPEANYSKLLKAIKTYYANYDTSSEEYLQRFTELELYKNWTDNCITTVEDFESWIHDVNTRNINIYEDISIDLIDSITGDTKRSVLYYNVLIFYIFSQNLTNEQSTFIVENIKNIAEEDKFKEGLEKVESENIRKILEILRIIHNDTVKSSVETSLKQLEDTSLGKLAKEIMSDINLDEMQSMFKDDDVLKSLGNPDGGLQKLLGSVSQKMLSKLASGEIKQDTLLQDAIAFSSQIRNIIPTNGGDGNQNNESGLGGDLLDQLQKMTGAMGGLGNLQDMMQSLNMGMGNQNAGGGGGKKQKTRVDSNEMSRKIKINQLRNKLKTKKESKEGK